MANLEQGEYNSLLYGEMTYLESRHLYFQHITNSPLFQRQSSQSQNEKFWIVMMS